MLRVAFITGELVSSRALRDFTEPFAEGEVRAKFRELAATVLTANGVAAIEECVNRIENWDSLDELITLCRCHGL